MNIDESATPARSRAELFDLAVAHGVRHRRRTRVRHSATGAVLTLMVVAVAMAGMPGPSTAIRSIGPAGQGEGEDEPMRWESAPSGAEAAPSKASPSGAEATGADRQASTSEPAGAGHEQASAAASSRRSTMILFRRDDGDIFEAQADGSGVRRAAPGTGYYHSWSPGRTAILWTDDGSLRVQPADAFGNVATVFEGTPSDGALWAAWMPDGNSVVFVRRTGFSNSQNALWTVDVQTKALRKLRAVATASAPVVAPDGRIAYSCVVEDRGRLCLTDGSGADLGFVPNSEHYGTYGWSPDGKWIAATAQVGGKRSSGLILIRPDGSDRRVLVRDGVVSKVGWFGHGDRVLFSVLGPDPLAPTTTGCEAPCPDAGGVWSIAVDGSDPQRITDGDRDVFEDAAPLR